MQYELEILQEENLVSNSKSNFYSIIFNKKQPKNVTAIVLPGKNTSDFIESVNESLTKFKEYSCKEYDPFENLEENYEYLIADEKITKTLNQVFSGVEGFKEIKNIKIEELRKSNVLICDMNWNKKNYYIFMEQKPFDKLYKGKQGFIIGDDKLKAIENSKLFFLQFDIGFICEKNNSDSIIYIFNKKYFEFFFDYEDHLKNKVKEHIDSMKAWTFINDFTLIDSKIEQKNVYRQLAKIVDDDEYMNVIKNTKPDELKKVLLAKGANDFSESDFDKNNRLIVTTSSMSKIIKMITKGFHYNFFEDKAE